MTAEIPGPEYVLASDEFVRALREAVYTRMGWEDG